MKKHSILLNKNVLVSAVSMTVNCKCHVTNILQLTETANLVLMGDTNIWEVENALSTIRKPFVMTKNLIL